MLLVSFVLLALFGVALPSILAHTSLAQSLLSRATSGYGLQVSAKSMQFGWITPIRLDGVQITGESGETKASMESIQTNLKLLDCFGSLSDLGQITIRGLDAEVAVADGRSSLEDDLAALLAGDSGAEPMTGTIDIQDANFTITDVGSDTAWFVGNVQSTVKLLTSGIEIQGSSVLTDPRGASGALEIGTKISQTPEPLSADQPAWQVDLRLRNVPLHIVTLLKRRFPESAGSLPDQLSGDASGVIQLTQMPEGLLSARFDSVEIRKLVAADSRLGQRTWANEFASLHGGLIYKQGVIQTRQLQAVSDFGNVTMSGNVPLPTGPTTSLAWVETISGSGAADIDLAKLERAAPGLLPLRSGATITAGRVTGKIDSRAGNDGQYRTVCSVRTSPIRGQAAGRPIVLEPVIADATFLLRDGVAAAEQIRLSSAFGTASGQGDLRSGTGKFDVDFSRLAAMLQPLVQLPDAGLRGTARGNIGWSAGAAAEWKLRGDLAANDLNILLPSGQSIRQPSLSANLDATGIWSGDTLAELNQLNATLNADGHRWEAKLLRAVREPASGNPLPLQIIGSGNCQPLVQLAGPWLPPELHSVAGSFTAAVMVEVAQTSGRLTAATISLQQPQAGWGAQIFTQPFLKLQFDGVYAWPRGELAAKTLTVEGDALSFAAVGKAAPESANLELGWRLDLQRLQNSVRTSIVQQTQPATIQQVNYVGPQPHVASESYVIQGRCEGSAVLTGKDGIWSIDTDAKANQLVISQTAVTARSTFTGPVRPSAAAHATDLIPLWSEPTASIRGVFRYDATTGGAKADHVRVASEWFDATVDGHVIWNETLGEIHLKGPSEIDMPLVAQRLSALAGQPIQLTGTHAAPMDILLQRQPDNQLSVDVRSSIGWQSGSVAGIGFGKSTANLRITDVTTTIEPTTIPMDLGQLHVAGQVHYGDGPLWFEQSPGLFAENIRLEPQMARKWLKYLAPLAADATEISGTVNLQLSECVVVPDDTQRSRVAGQLSVQGIDMNAGPLANQVILGIDQMKNLSRGLSGGQAPARTRRLLSIPAQVVEFDLRDGVVNHQRMYFTIDDARVITSGSVAIDGRLNLMAQVPLEARWLGSDVQSLAGETITLPISGTFSRPTLNTAAITQMVGNLGLKAAQQSAENYLQQQMNRGLERLLGR